MLEPSKSAPDFDEQMKKFKQDPSNWGIPASVVDMTTSPINTPQPDSPQEEAAEAAAAKAKK